MELWLCLCMDGGTPDEKWQELRDERASQIRSLTVLSSNAKFIIAPERGHAIQNDNPELVANAIQMFLNSLKYKTRL